jgi:hypothetical protein
MAKSEPVINNLVLPEDWKVVGSGTNRYQKGLENRFLVIDTSRDVLTMLVYFSEVAVVKMSELASWSRVRRVKINEHDAQIYTHPEGYRKLLTWYCPESEETYLVHFSIDNAKLTSVFRKTKCH